MAAVGQNYKDRLKRGIALSTLPNTFKHVVQVTRKLGIRYLWIDSLCIKQGDGGDFETEAKNMETVFSVAYCVIAASRASGTSRGFLWERPERRFVKLADRSQEPIYVCQNIDDIQHDMIEGDLNKRGWVLQERALARRTVYFHQEPDILGVRCETLQRMTNNQAAFLGDADFPKLAMSSTRGAKIRFFESLYEQYSRLDLSTVYDQPLAIAGLEQRLVNAFSTDGGYGIFDGDFLGRSLLWKRDESRSNRLKRVSFPQL